MDKAETRFEIREQRRALSLHQQHIHAMEVSKQLVRMPWYQRARNIGLYISADGELSTDYLLAHARNFSKRVFLPVLHPYRHGRLLFCEWREGAELIPNRYGILEPELKRSTIAPTRSLDLVVVPLVAFDMDRNRLGMGGGYYDRTFEVSRRQSCWKRPRLVGVAHELQKREKIEASNWDVSLDAVVTEATVY